MTRSLTVFTKWAVKSFDKLIDVMGNLSSQLETIANKDNGKVVIENSPEVSVNNLPDKTEVYGTVNAKLTEILRVELEDYPEELRNIKIPKVFYNKLAKEYSKLEDIQGEIKNFAKEFKDRKTQKLPINADPDEYMNVRLTNGEDFMRTLVTSVGGAVSEGLMPGVVYNKVEVEYPDDVTERYKFYYNTDLRNTVEIEYETSSKNNLITVTRT